MQFSIIALILSAALVVSAAPAPVTNAENLAPNVLSKRTCGTLTGTALKVCQDACKVTCVGSSESHASTQIADHTLYRLLLLLVLPGQLARRLATHRYAQELQFSRRSTD